MERWHMTRLRSTVWELAMAVVIGVAAEGGHLLDAAAPHQVFDHEAVAADVVLAEQIELELSSCGVSLRPMTALKSWLLAM